MKNIHRLQKFQQRNNCEMNYSIYNKEDKYEKN